ncbi:MAG: hypothetical protein ACU85V_09275 [Gammaproteobacteria bacterium]
MHAPVVVAGWGQVTQPKSATPPWLDPVDMMTEAAREAGRVAGPGMLDAVDAVLVVRTQSRVLEQPDVELARRLGLEPRISEVSGIGGQVPQQFVNRAAGLLARGEATAVLICGAETYYPRSADAVRGEGALIQGIPEDYDAEDAIGASAHEQRHGLGLPIHGFPLFEVALWAQSGLPLDAWLDQVGRMWSGFSEVAARHPNAWTREPVDARTIVTPTPDNRPIAFPYTKRMVSLVMADLGAAVILTTAARAAAMRDGPGRAVYFRGGGFAKAHQRFMADKARFTESPALMLAASRAGSRAGIEPGAVDCFDLYSCFPCAVTVAKAGLGIGDGDPRELTQTGGLGFFGGPGSNYALHGIASMAETLAAGRHETGLTSALGWFMHKYAVGIYATTPGTADLARADLDDEADPLAGDPPVALDEAPTGSGTIETYTVIYNRERQPVRGVIYGRTAAGARFVANTPDEDTAYAALTEECRVGAAVALSVDPADGRTIAQLDV